jgi:hypothetical protein
MDLFGSQRLDSAPIIAPAFVPSTVESDPLGPLILRTGFSMSYAPTDSFSGAHVAAAQLSQSGRDEVVVQIGTYGEKANAERIGGLLKGYGRVEISDAGTSDGAFYTVRVATLGAPDGVIAAARDAGIGDAFVVTR